MSQPKKYSTVIKTQQGEGWSIRYRETMDPNNQSNLSELDLLQLKNYILEYVETMHDVQLMALKFDIGGTK